MLAKYNFFCSLLFCLFCFTTEFQLQAQLQHFQQNDIPYIEVEGSAEKEIIPDEIYTRITLRERTEGKKTISVTSQEEELKKGIQSLGLSLDDLSFSDADADFIKIKWRKKGVISQAQYTMKTIDASSTAKLFELLDELKIKDAFIVKIDYSEKEILRKELKIKAIKVAKEKAKYLVEAIDNSLGKPLKILEISENRPRYDYQYMGRQSNFVLDDIVYESEESIPELQFEKLKYRYEVYVAFEIK